MPSIDLVFVINAASSDSDNTFTRMKSVMGNIVDKYGIDRIHYGVVLYGERPSIQLRFQNRTMTENQLKRIIVSLPKPSGAPLLDRALKEAMMLLNSSARPDAKKIVLVITDKGSANTKDELEKSSLALEQNGIRIVALTIGGEADVEELENVVNRPSDIINTQGHEKPDSIATKIITVVTKGTILFIATDVDISFKRTRNNYKLITTTNI